MMDDDPVRNLALEGIDRAAQADDLLKPTEERVREIVEQLREPNADNGDHSQYDEWAMRFNAASFLEILSAENKALREKHQAALKSLELWAEVEGRHNPTTHVAVPREPTTAMLTAFYQAYNEAPTMRDMGMPKLKAGVDAMLSAAEDQE